MQRESAPASVDATARWSTIAGFVNLLFIAPTLGALVLFPNVLAFALAIGAFAFGVSGAKDYRIPAALVMVLLYLLSLVISLNRWWRHRKLHKSSVTTVLWAVSPAVPLCALLLLRWG